MKNKRNFRFSFTHFFRVCKIIFLEMKYLPPDQFGPVETGDVRRLGTKSTAVSSAKNFYSTTWRWYWQNENNAWIEFGQVWQTVYIEFGQVWQTVYISSVNIFHQTRLMLFGSWMQ